MDITDIEGSRTVKRLGVRSGSQSSLRVDDIPGSQPRFVKIRTNRLDHNPLTPVYKINGEVIGDIAGSRPKSYFRVMRRPGESPTINSGRSAGRPSMLTPEASAAKINKSLDRLTHRAFNYDSSDIRTSMRDDYKLDI
jgi:hypothetical protein